MEIRPLDFPRWRRIDYDITKYQPILFGAESFGQLEDAVGGFFAGHDDTPERLVSPGDRRLIRPRGGDVRRGTDFGAPTESSTPPCGQERGGRGPPLSRLRVLAPPYGSISIVQVYRPGARTTLSRVDREPDRPIRRSRRWIDAQSGRRT